MAERLNRYQTYLKEGYTDEEIQNHLRPIYQKNGFTDEQIDEYFKKNASVKENKVTVTDVIKDVFNTATQPMRTLTDTSVKIEEPVEDVMGKTLNPIEPTKEIVNISTVKEKEPQQKVEPSLRARTKEDDNIDYEFLRQNNPEDTLSAEEKINIDRQGLQHDPIIENVLIPANFIRKGLMTKVGFGILEGIQQAKNIASSKIQGKDYDAMAYENLSSLLPDNTPSVLRVTSNLAELVADCIVAGNVTEKVRRYLIRENAVRIAERMAKKGYNEEQIKNAVDGYKKEVVARETGLRQEQGDTTDITVKGTVKAEPKPINVDEALKMRVDVERAKIPEPPKEKLKADVEVEPITEPKQIETKPVEPKAEVKVEEVKPTETVKVTEEIKPTNNYADNFKDEKNIEKFIENNIVNSDMSSVEAKFNGRKSFKYTEDIANKLAKISVDKVISNHLEAYNFLKTFPEQGSYTNGAIAIYDKDFAKELYEKQKEKLIKRIMKDRKLNKEDAEKYFNGELEYARSVNIEAVKPDLKGYKPVKMKYITESFSGKGYNGIFDDGNYVDMNYYSLIKKRFPNAKILTNGEKKPIAFVDKDKIVAVVMPIQGRQDYTEKVVKEVEEAPKKVLQTLKELKKLNKERQELEKKGASKEEIEKKDSEIWSKYKDFQVLTYELSANQRRNDTTEEYKGIQKFQKAIKTLKETPANNDENRLKIIKAYKDMGVKLPEKRKDQTVEEYYNENIKKGGKNVDALQKQAEQDGVVDRIKNINTIEDEYFSKARNAEKENLKQLLKEDVEAKQIKTEENVEQEEPEIIYDKNGKEVKVEFNDKLVDTEKVEPITIENKILNDKKITKENIKEIVFGKGNKEKVYLKNSSTGKEYYLSNRALLKMYSTAETSKKDKEISFNVLADIKNIFDKANFILKHKDLEGVNRDIERFATITKTPEGDYFVLFTAKNGKIEEIEYNNLYDMKVVNKKTVPSTSGYPQEALAPTYKIADLKNFVNRYLDKYRKNNNNLATSKTDFSRQTDVELPKVTKTHEELIKKSEIIRDLAKETDLPVKIGGTQRKNILGLYYQKEELVRLQVANDMLTLAHEIGHHEEKVLFGGVARKYKDFTPKEKEFFVELKPLATKPKGNETKGKVFSEGLAQFISMFVNNPAQAQAVAPKFYKFFTEQAPIKTPIQYEALKKAQAQMSKYYSQNAINTVKSHISFKEESPKLTVKEKFDKITESIRTQFFDKLEPLRQAVRKAYQKAGMEISDTEANNPYFLARLYSGAVGRAEVFLNKHTYDFKTLQKTGKALGDIIKDIHNKGGNLEDFASYLVAHDTIELAKRNINSGVELEAAKQTVKELAPVYDSYAQELYQYRLSLLKMLKDGQVITDEAYNNIINASKRYAPLQRVLEDNNINVVGNRNFKSKNPLKNIKGSGRDIINPLETIIENTYNVIKLVEKNRVGLALAKLSRLDKSGAFVFGPIHKTKTERDFEGNESIGSDYTINENNEIKVFINGKPQIYEVDKSIAKIMNGLSTENQLVYSKVLENVATMPAKMLKFGATDVNVAFAFKNILRDLPLALVNSENKFNEIAKAVLDITVLGLKALTNEKARLEWNEIADQMNKAGGGQSLLINDNRDSTIKAIDDLKYSGYLDKIWNKVKERDFIEAAKTGIIGTTEAVRALVGFLEQVPRMAEFVSSLEGKPLTKENLEQAGFNARKITLDFASGGNFAKWINKYVPYSNAFTLGIDVVNKVFRSPTKRARLFLGVFGIYAIINVLGRLINGDDEEVNDVNRTQKYTNFVFKIGDTIYRIPKTIELAPFYTTIDTAINAIFDTIKGTKTDKKEYLKDIYGSIEANLIPEYVAPIIKLPLELYANKSMFFKTPIVSAELEKVLPEYQYTEYTTELSKFIAKTLGNIGINKGLIARTIGSPQRLEYIVNSLTGNTGKYLFEKADQIGRLTGLLPDKEYELPEKTLADIPFARAFVIRYPQQSRAIEEFYEKYKEIKKYEETFKLAVKRVDTDTINKFAIYQSIRKVTKISQDMSKARKMILITYIDKNMNKHEKRQVIDEIMLERLALAKQGLNVMKEIEENIKEEK